jgi:lysozyme family protein
MINNWKSSLEKILHHEGGYVNHPKDPGGETNLGVTKRVYEEWGGTKDMKDLLVEDVNPIYKKNYWDKCKCDDLPNGLDLCVFDFGHITKVYQHSTHLVEGGQEELKKQLLLQKNLYN